MTLRKECPICSVRHRSRRVAKRCFQRLHEKSSRIDFTYRSTMSFENFPDAKGMVLDHIKKIRDFEEYIKNMKDNDNKR